MRCERAWATGPVSERSPFRAGIGLALLPLACMAWVGAIAPTIRVGTSLFQLTMLVYALAVLGLNIAHRLQRPDLARPRRLLCVGAYITAILMSHYGLAVLGDLSRPGGGLLRRRLPFGFPALRLAAITSR